jgi:PAS domain-containing protein
MKTLLDIASESITAGSQDFPAYPLFKAAGAAVLVVEQGTGRVAEANLAALALLGLAPAGLVGKDWLGAFSAPSAQRLADACRHAWLANSPIQIEAESFAGARALVAAITTFRVGRDAYLLVRLVLHDAMPESAGQRTSAVLDALERMPTGFVVTDSRLQVDFGNRAFLEMVQLESLEQLRGRSLAQWLALTEADLLRLREQMSRRQAASVLVTTLHAGPVIGRSVEVTAIAVPDAPHPCWGFTLRLLESRLPAAKTPHTDG